MRAAPAARVRHLNLCDAQAAAGRRQATQHARGEKYAAPTFCKLFEAPPLDKARRYAASVVCPALLQKSLWRCNMASGMASFMGTVACQQRRGWWLADAVSPWWQGGGMRRCGVLFVARSQRLQPFYNRTCTKPLPYSPILRCNTPNFPAGSGRGARNGAARHRRSLFQ